MWFIIVLVVLVVISLTLAVWNPNLGVRAIAAILIAAISFTMGRQSDDKSHIKPNESTSLLCVDGRGCHIVVIVDYFGTRKQTMERATDGSTVGWRDAIILEDPNPVTFK